MHPFTYFAGRMHPGVIGEPAFPPPPVPADPPNESSWLQGVPVATVFPTGGDDGAAISQAFTKYPVVRVIPGETYQLLSPIIMPSYSKLTGDFWNSASGADNYSAGVLNAAGAVLVMAPGFTGSAAIQLVNSGSTQQGAVVIEGLSILGFQLSAGTIYGILVQGAWGACFMRGVCVRRPPADCVRFITDPTSGHIPDDWLISQCKFSNSRNGYGVYAAELADSWWSECESSENFLDGWYINYGVNTRFNNCKGENNTGAGFHLTGLGNNQVQYFTGCSTHINQLDGFLFDNAGPAGGGADSTYVMTGCITQQDSQSSTSGGFAGYRSSGSKARIIGTGCVSQIDLAGTHPQYGASEVSASFGMCFTGSLLQGATATHDDGSNTNALVNQSPVPF